MYKRLATLCFATLLLASCGSPSGPAFRVESEQASAGETVSMTYNPSRTDLKGAETVTAYAAVFSPGDFHLVEIPTQKSGGIHEFEAVIPSDATGMLFWFRDEHGLADLNESRGYAVPVLNASGEPAPSYTLDLASVYQNIDLFLGIEVSPDTLKKWVDHSVEEHPELTASHFASLAATARGRAATDERKAHVDSLFKTIFASQDIGTMPQETLESLRQYASLRKEQGLAAEFETLDAALKASFPQSTAFMADEYRKYSTSKKPADWLAGADSLATKFDVEDSKSYMSNLYYRYLSTLNSRKSYDSILTAAPSFKYWDGSLYSMLATSLKGTMPDEALQWADKNVEFAKNRLENAGQDGPSKADPYTSKKGLKSALSFAYKTKADVLLAAGDTLAAAELLGEAVALMDNEPSSTISEAYAEVMNDTGQGEKIFDTLKEFVVSSTNSAKTDSIMHSIYLESEMGSEEDYEALRAELTEKADEYLVAKTRGKMMDRLAPDFELYDTEGNVVKLSDYRGKAVVVDFWATWCGPCIASFPDMKKAMATLDADQVHFLYVHTWDEPAEDGKTRAEIAKEFMDGKGYEGFHTLVDETDQVCSVDYMVKGIPTKFVVGADGRIKFKSIGYNSNAEYMKRELRSMIALALDEQATEPVAMVAENAILKIESPEAPAPK